MYKVLVPEDGSVASAAAVRHAIGLCRSHPDAEMHVVNVQPRLTRHAARFLPKSAIEAERRRRRAGRAW
jgi:nucleotide-binding universal stress UspA family protein